MLLWLAVVCAQAQEQVTMPLADWVALQETTQTVPGPAMALTTRDRRVSGSTARGVFSGALAGMWRCCGQRGFPCFRRR